MPNSKFSQKYYYSFTLRVAYHPMTAKNKAAFLSYICKTKQKILKSYNSPLKVSKFKIPSIQNGNYIFFHAFSHPWKDGIVTGHGVAEPEAW